jgi:hypothetical protein
MTHFMISNFFFRKFHPLWDNVEKYCKHGEATDYKMANALWSEYIQSVRYS